MWISRYAHVHNGLHMSLKLGAPTPMVPTLASSGIGLCLNVTVTVTVVQRTCYYWILYSKRYRVELLRVVSA